MTTDTYSRYMAHIPEHCNMIPAAEGTGTNLVYHTGKMFVKKMEEIMEAHDNWNARFHVGTVLMKLIIPYTGN